MNIIQVLILVFIAIMFFRGFNKEGFQAKESKENKYKF